MKMKAAQIIDKKTLEIIDFDKPESVEGRPIIKVAYAGVCGSDLHYWANGDTFAKGWIMGHEFVGYIEDPGSREDLKKGDRVIVIPSKACMHCEFCDAGQTTLCEAPLTEALGIGVPGGYAEYVRVRPHVVIKLEDNVDLKEATVIEPATVGLHAARKAGSSEKDTALVIGAGIIGLMTAMWVRKQGIKNLVIAEAGDNRIEWAKKFGFADTVIDSKADDFLDQVIAANNGEKYDYIFECVGIEATLNGYLDALKSGGTMMVLGVPNDKIPFNFNNLITKNKKLIPSHAWNFVDFYDAVEYLTKGEIDLKQFITDVEPLSKVQEVFEDLTSGNTQNVKVLLEVAGE